MHGPMNVKLCFAVNVFMLILCAKCGGCSLTLCAVNFTIYLLVLDIVEISRRWLHVRLK
jgi:hypothetical protein